jgi:hypothetical protein
VTYMAQQASWTRPSSPAAGPPVSRAAREIPRSPSRRIGHAHWQPLIACSTSDTSATSNSSLLRVCVRGVAPTPRTSSLLNCLVRLSGRPSRLVAAAYKSVIRSVRRGLASCARAPGTRHGDPANLVFFITSSKLIHLSVGCRPQCCRSVHCTRQLASPLLSLSFLNSFTSRADDLRRHRRRGSGKRALAPNPATSGTRARSVAVALLATITCRFWCAAIPTSLAIGSNTHPLLPRALVAPPRCQSTSEPLRRPVSGLVIGCSRCTTEIALSRLV